MDGMRIGELAERTGFAHSQIRFYERRGLLPPPARRESGYRDYSEADVARLRLLGQVKRLGLSLAQAREVLAAAEHGCCGATDAALAEAIARRIAEIDRHVAELTELRATLTQALQGQAPPQSQAADAPVGCAPGCGQQEGLPEESLDSPGASTRQLPLTSAP